MMMMQLLVAGFLVEAVTMVPQNLGPGLWLASLWVAQRLGQMEVLRQWALVLGPVLEVSVELVPAVLLEVAAVD